MATWIIHLRVAQALLPRIDPTCGEVFVLGNIAPDSGVPSADGTSWVPSSRISHFTDQSAIKDVHEERFIAAYLTAEQRRGYNKRQYTFYLGYLTHLLTDKIWARDIACAARDRFSDLFQTDRDAFWRNVKRDWYSLDFLYLRDHPDFPAIRLYAQAAGENPYLDFFPVDAFARRRAFILDFYRRGVETVTRRETYLTMEDLDRFVAQAAAEITAAAGLYFQELLE